MTKKAAKFLLILGVFALTTLSFLVGRLSKETKTIPQITTPTPIYTFLYFC